MADQNEKAVTFKGAIKSKNHIKIKNKDYGIKTEKWNVPVRETFIIRQKKSMKFKGAIKPKDYIKIKNKDYGVKSEKRDVPVRKMLMTRQKKAQLIRQSASNLGQAVLSTSIKATENNENKEITENINLIVPKSYHNKHNDRFNTKKGNKNNQRKKPTSLKKQCEKDNAVKKSRDSHTSKIIDRKREDSISGIKKSSRIVKTKNTKIIKRQQASRRVKKSVSKKAGVKLTAGTIKGIKSKAILLSIGSAVIGATKAIASFVALKFLAPIGILGITLIIIVSILVAIVGVVASVDPYIPITEEVLVTEIHVHLTELDVDWSEANGTSIQTDSKDVIALVFMGGVDPERESNDAILAEVTEFHQAFHESGASDVVSFLATHPFLSVVASDFPEFREFAFIHFYGTLGDPYEKNWRDAVTSHFGWRPDPFGSGDRGMHTGIDIAWAGIGGTPVLATISGTVQVAGYNEGGYGNWVMIVNDDDPENRKETRYAHLRTISVSVGQRIEVGDVVGLTGTTGSSTGDHLHYEFHRNGHLLNPYFYFPNEAVLEIDKGGGE